MISLKIKEDKKGIKRIFVIYPDIHADKRQIPTPIHILEIDDCLNKLKLIVHDNFPNFRILKITVFVSCKNLQDFTEKKNEFTELLKSNSDLSEFPLLFVAQPPANNMNVAVEVLALMLPASEYVYEYGNMDNISFCKVASGEYMEIYGTITNGTNNNPLTPFDKGESVYQQSMGCFEDLKNILEKNNLDFGNVVRQWGYIGGITNYELRITNGGKTNNRLFDSAQSDKIENYQMFNMARAEFYKNADWKYGYPAATGIGANVEGCSIEFVATNDNPNKLIIPLHNPKQSDAHRYTGKNFNNLLNPALIRGNFRDKSKSFNINDESDTPKFERGKIVITGETLDLYVSGTAAIIGEVSVSGDIREQTKTTLDNITKLCSKENLEEHGLFIEGDLPLFSGVRAYIKYPQDIPVVEKMCRKKFGDVPILCVIADVCREELLVEIEAFLNCNIDIQN